jgi:hypothetical protein
MNSFLFEKVFTVYESINTCTHLQDFFVVRILRVEARERPEDRALSRTTLIKG